MRFYENAPTLAAEQDQFELDVKEFSLGNINPIKFKAIRVAHGVYEQRQEHTYMIRIRCAAGGITPSQLKKVAEIAENYGSGEVHFTTRQEVQIHNVLIQDLLKAIRELTTVGLSSRGGGGNTIRNILTSPDSGIKEGEAFDVDPYAIALTTRMIDEPDSWNLPRKFKIAMSNDENDTAFTQATCLGFVAQIKEGKKGFKVFCAGGMGAKPMIGNLLFDWVEEYQVYQITKALKIMFDKHGNRRNKNANRIKFLWQKLEREEFVRLFKEEFDKIKDDRSLDLKLEPLENVARATSLAVETVSSPEFQKWKNRYVLPQKQPGLVSIKLPLQLGDLLKEDADLLCDFLENFGDNSIRCDRAQNMRLRNIPEQYVGNVYTVIKSLKKTLADHAPFIGNMINCTGAQTCKLGICLPRGLSSAIRNRLSKSNLDLDRLNDFRLNMSGCPNTCGMHHIAHLGFFGKVGRSKARDMFPMYNVLVGAKVSAGETQYAEKKGELAAHHIPNFVHDFLEAYLLKKEDYKDYYVYLEEEGNEVIKSLCEIYASVPEFSEDPTFYTDFGAKRKLSLDDLGTAECSAGMFDMIDVDKKIITTLKRELESLTDEAKIQETMYKILLSSARMLLVTRGLDADKEEVIFQLFGKHFVETELVSPSYQDVIVLGKLKVLPEIAKQKETVLKLASDVIELYEGMDDSLRFNVKPKETAQAAEEILKKDYRGVQCPMNFVKTKLVLETMQSGQKLEVLLDDGEPIQNVPNSVVLEGHKVLDKKKDGTHWAVLIQKA